MIFFKARKNNRLILITILLATGMCLTECTDAPFPTMPEPEEVEPFHPIVGVWQWDRTCSLWGSDCVYPDIQTGTVKVFFENDSSYTKTVNDFQTEASNFEVFQSMGPGFEVYEILEIVGEERPAQIEYIRNDTLRLITWDEQDVFSAVHYLRLE